jgi:hypothetical protein
LTDSPLDEKPSHWRWPSSNAILLKDRHRSSGTRKLQKLQATSIRRERLEAFARLDPAIDKYLGADRMPPSMRTIPGDGRICVGGDQDAA